jgi:hypothetical protein
MPYTIEIDGLDEYREKFSDDLIAGPTRYFLNSGGTAIRAKARALAPRDRGALRSSMSYLVQSGKVPTWVKIGSNDMVARPMEFGTGLLSIAPDSSHRRHFPPPGALQGWALRHGFTDGPGSSIWSTAGGKVARAIGIRGGLAPRRFLFTAMEEFKSNPLPTLVQTWGRGIENNWSKR